jgi:RNA polymerase sigma-70 factor (ECF subfamily)
MEPDTIECLLETYQHRVFRIAFYLTRDRHEAEDLFQDTWLNVCDKRHQFENVRDPKSWILTILMNRFRDLCRKKRISRIYRLEIIRVSEEHAATHSGFDTFEITEALRQALQNIPDKQRMVFILKYIEGYKQTEIGRMTGMPEGTVKSVLFRAVKRMQKELEDFRI